MKKHRFLFLAMIMCVIVALREIYSLCVYFYDIAVARGNKTFFAKICDLSRETDITLSNKKTEEKNVDKWILQTPKKFYTILSEDKLFLFASCYIHKKPTDKTAVIIHGYGGKGELMYYAAKAFYEKGFNVVVPDCRGHGKSQGSYIGMGWHDRKDIALWCDKIINANNNAEIVLYGVSMGGAAVMMASGESLPENVKCIVEDCGYTSVYDEFKYQLKKLFSISKIFPVDIILNFVSVVCKFKSGYSFKEADAVSQVKKCKKPILFIHGKNDDFVPCEMVYRLYNSAKCEKELFIVDNAGHGVSVFADKNRYWEKVFGFIKKHMDF